MFAWLSIMKSQTSLRNLFLEKLCVDQGTWFEYGSVACFALTTFTLPLKVWAVSIQNYSITLGCPPPEALRPCPGLWSTSSSVLHGKYKHPSGSFLISFGSVTCMSRRNGYSRFSSTLQTSVLNSNVPLQPIALYSPLPLRG